MRCSVWVGLITLLLASDARAVGPFGFVGGGASILGDSQDREYWDPGWNVVAGGGLELIPQFEAVGSVAYSRFALKDDNMLGQALLPGYADGPANGFDITVLSVMVGTKVSLVLAPGRIQPYGMFRVGWHHSEIDAGSIPATAGTQSYTANISSIQDDVFGAMLGLGVDTRVARRTTLFLEGNLVNGFTQDESTRHYDISLGLTFR